MKGLNLSQFQNLNAQTWKPYIQKLKLKLHLNIGGNESKAIYVPYGAKYMLSILHTMPCTSGVHLSIACTVLRGTCKVFFSFFGSSSSVTMLIFQN